MQNYRVGDEVLIEVPAVVVNTERQDPKHGGIVRVRFGDIDYSAKLGAMIMIKPSFHVHDYVMHEGREGTLVQKLEKNIFLMHYENAEGVNAYGVVNSDNVQHVQKNAEYSAVHAALQTSEAEVLELSDPIEEPASEEPAVPSLANIVAEEFDAPRSSEPEVLVLKEEAAEEESGKVDTDAVEEPAVAEAPVSVETPAVVEAVSNEDQHNDEEGNEPEEETSSSVTNEARLMASALSGLVGKANAAKRKPIDLAALGGSTEVVDSVNATAAAPSSENSSSDSSE